MQPARRSEDVRPGAHARAPLLDAGLDVNAPAFVECAFRATPLKWSRFVGAERLLRHGANVNFQNSRGVTALHLVLKKNSDRRHVEMLLDHGADPTIKSRDGQSPLDLVRTRRDKSYFNLLLARRPAAPPR